MPIGPSPRAWGSRLRAASPSTPHAGPSPRAWGYRRAPVLDYASGPDHPHARGDNQASAQTVAVKLDRTIPTRVGISLAASRRSGSTSDHPHARGDNLRASPPSTAAFGPSPRAWGLRDIDATHGLVKRTIPTRVGITAGPRPRRASRADHPHARGDFAVLAESCEPADGPSPRAWGFRSRGLSDQPSLGPSPRAWGFRLSRARRHRHGRTIPTRVGISVSREGHYGQTADHPHARGDNRRALLGPCSSPRTIPTRVGIS